MLNKSLDKKLFLLKLCLYLIICIICFAGINKAIDTYKSISHLSADEISKWLNKTSGLNYFVDAKKIKLNWDGLSVYFTINDISVTSVDNKSSITNTQSSTKRDKIKSTDIDTIAKLEQITGRINILSTILSGKIKIHNFVAKNINLTVNSIYHSERIKEIIGNIDININLAKSVDKILQITAEFVVDNIDFKIDAILSIRSNNIELIKFKLENTADNIRDVIKYLPEYFINQKLLYWLDNALLSGSVKHSDLFLDENNVFTWKVKFKDVKLQYARNWPAIEKLSATMEIVDDNFNIDIEPNANQAFILGQPLKHLSARLIGVNLDEASPLLIKAEIMAPINKAIEFLKKTDLRPLSTNLDKLSLNGKMNLLIQLLIPTDDFTNTTELIEFSGDCELIKASLKPLDWNVNITNLIGNIKFANNYLSSDDLHATIFDMDVDAKFVLDHDYLFIENSLFKTKILLDQNNQQNIFLNKNFNIMLEELFLFDNMFNKIRIINNLEDNILSFDSLNAKGSLIYSDMHSGKYDINFDKLKIDTKNKQLSENNPYLLMSSINQIKFNCENFYLNETYLGKISYNFIKDIKLQDKKLIHIDQLYFKNKEIDVDASGSWQIEDFKKSKTNISGKLYSTDFGSAFSQYNSNNKFIKNGNGLINFDLEWLKDPFGFDLNNINGKLKLDIRSGVIVGVNPGLGRIIGLLSIENIQRRLQLDFSDVTGGGFSFDTLNGDLNVIKGQVVFNNVVINGPSANLTINGNTSLISQQLDLSIEVTSKVGATLPLAAAIAAGNPVIGAALWLFDHASGAKVSEFKVQKYKVIGTWSKPEINAI